ncbi:4-diphosphocytidyl-2-C-methyl-D-erythritol kinase [Intestinibacter bartlettii DSM 16795]|uniref:4-(cytidine 5'-diphospho)-2-C-methyl-D-erythritol kinase n=1 Tax=Intestinibacter bartlettii TaxID=261299 RepID=UPI0001631534|nr:4-(cytidine 5'-diphospho)-2-C-methyl-D-erythritol kinase [Intestinibacter bartlettii]EDQ97827.1 4-(cytidine 5'-diphospho)-2-C-methyl-D-erythritol kinase [Intestinibacter bartlettii DSM 16795]UWO81090.1 4-(cytidine 5'-diphospho)-2-C-methyl-D-erythritol kinase [Intestinibacter bartlettii]SKA60903.1 4-diphosphocytidyl-2-C-methyl-D-erythritol kinase [Intestinibacter bartlettii DSM 16795]
MNSITLKSRAKINLSIDVLGKRQDGYHLVEMIMQTIDLYDLIEINEKDNDQITIKSTSDEIPLDCNNLVYKAANLIKKTFNINKGVEIHIKKNIPVAAGMAGGSSNAAAVLVGLNKLWNLNLSNQQLEKIGLKLGADVPFCINGGAVLALGIGEELTPIKGLTKDVCILVCKPDLFVSTKEVYECIDSKDIDKRPNNKFLIECLKNEDTRQLAENMFNVLEGVTMDKHPVIQQIKDIMTNNRALGAMMSGSGPTVFGLYENREDAVKCKAILEKQFKQTFVVACEEKGVEVNG